MQNDVQKRLRASYNLKNDLRFKGDSPDIISYRINHWAQHSRNLTGSDQLVIAALFNNKCYKCLTAKVEGCAKPKTGSLLAESSGLLTESTFNTRMMVHRD